MGKKQDSTSDNSIKVDSSPPKKRHKKHKKHKKRRQEYVDSDAIDVETEVAGDTVFNTLQISAAEKLKSQNSPNKILIQTPSKPLKKKRPKGGKDSGTSSEEERWLDAIESGKLEEVDDELKKIKDPKLMTARQRAMYERGADKDAVPSGETLMSLPSGYKEKVMTAEAIQKAILKSQKRKQLADEKREKDKKKTMDRLLKKQDSSKSKSTKNKTTRHQVPMISYRNTADLATITFPPDFEFPFNLQMPRDPPKPTICAMPGCTNIKKYNCSKTNTPLCSFKCYKQNVDSIKQIIC